MRIENADGFGLAFNCIVRLYKRNCDVELLVLLNRICDAYLRWFRLQTVFCAVRDLLCDRLGEENLRVPEEQKKEFEILLQRLVRQCITLECSRCENDNLREENLYEFGKQVGLIPGVYENVKFQSAEDFLIWVKEYHLDKPAEHRMNHSKKTLPIERGFIRDFGKICLLMIQYSLGRKTHMRYACYTFVYHNIRLLDDKMLVEIREYIKSVRCGENKAYWMNLKTVLGKESQRRKLLSLYTEIYEDDEALNLLLAGCVSAEVLVSFEICREAWWIISVFEEFIKKQNVDERQLKYQNFVRRAKEIIGRELHRYEKVLE